MISAVDAGLLGGGLITHIVLVYTARQLRPGRGAGWVIRRSLFTILRVAVIGLVAVVVFHVGDIEVHRYLAAHPSTSSAIRKLVPGAT